MGVYAGQFCWHEEWAVKKVTTAIQNEISFVETELNTGPPAVSTPPSSPRPAPPPPSSPGPSSPPTSPGPPLPSSNPRSPFPSNTDLSLSSSHSPPTSPHSQSSLSSPTFSDSPEQAVWDCYVLLDKLPDDVR